VVKHGLDRASSNAPAQGLRKASSSQAQGADRQGSRYYVQLALEGVPYHKPKHTAGSRIKKCGWQKQYGKSVGLRAPGMFVYVIPWQGGEARLQAAHAVVLQRANEGQILPGSFGVPRARARRLESQSDPPLEPAFVFRHERLEAWSGAFEPLDFSRRELSVLAAERPATLPWSLQ
jgi:hypothetical protein